MSPQMRKRSTGVEGRSSGDQMEIYLVAAFQWQREFFHLSSFLSSLLPRVVGFHYSFWPPSKCPSNPMQGRCSIFHFHETTSHLGYCPPLHSRVPHLPLTHQFLLLHSCEALQPGVHTNPMQTSMSGPPKTGQLVGPLNSLFMPSSSTDQADHLC